MLQEGSFLVFPTIDDVEAYHDYAHIPLSNSLKNRTDKVTDQLKGGNIGALRLMRMLRVPRMPRMLSFRRKSST
jgi:hypothetical protein